MGERGLEVLDKYDIEVQRTVKVRGAVMCETDKGTYQLKEFSGSASRIELEDRILNSLAEKIHVETYLRNRDGELITESDDGIRYAVKTWHEGKECNVRDIKEVCLAVRLLAWLHREFEHVDELNRESGEEADPENSVREECAKQREELPELFIRHNKELNRVRTYIKSRKSKNGFERLVMESFDSFYSQAAEAFSILQQTDLCIKEGWRHGEFSHHHVILGPRKNVITEFTHMNRGIQIEDLYYFTRKVLEKNRWDIKLGRAIFESYSSVRKISPEEWDYLYLLFLYPEKYWKQLNFYYNSNKAWIPEKNVNKLQAVINQQPQRNAFLEDLKSQTGFAKKNL